MGFSSPHREKKDLKRKQERKEDRFSQIEMFEAMVESD
jgi:hypothetical protein